MKLARRRPLTGIDTTEKRDLRTPGETGIWVLVFGDLTVFALFFLTFLYYRSLDLQLFSRSRDLLNQNFGAINTLLLLTSSWLVALAVLNVRAGKGRRAGWLFLGGIACALGFAGVKVLEYSEKFRHGITLNYNDFFMFYFMLTGIHFLHVVIGIVVLAVLARASFQAEPQNRMMLIECGATFWHVVDLLWLVLFPLLYLMK